MAKVSAFVLPQALVTVHRADFDIDPVVKAWDDGPEMLEYGGRGLLYGLLDVIVDGHLDCLQQLDDRVEEAEDRLFDEQPRSGTDVQRQTYQLRRQMTGVRKVVLPMRDVADTMLRHAELHQSEHQTEIVERLRDLRDHVIRANEWNDSLRDVVATIFETGLSLADARLNQIVRKLSGWAAIIAVPTAVTGFYGQNLPYPGFGQWWGFVASSVITVVAGRRDLGAVPRSAAGCSGSAGDRELHLLELLQARVAALGHRPAQRAEHVRAPPARPRSGRAAPPTAPAAGRRPRTRRAGRGSGAARTGAASGARRWVPVPAGAGRLGRRGPAARRASPRRRRRPSALAMSPLVVMSAVGDQVHVPAAGLVQVVAPGRGRVGDRGGHRHPDAQHRRRWSTRRRRRCRRSRRPRRCASGAARSGSRCSRRRSPARRGRR